MPAVLPAAFAPLFAVLLAALLALSGCAGAPDDGRQADAATAADRGTSALDAELLYDLLLAEIAGRRGHHQKALESLSRAAYQSRDRRIVARAVRLAVRAQDHQRVIELSRLLADIAEPDFRHQLALAHAQFQTGHDEQAFALLIDLARAQGTGGEGGEAGLRAIAAVLAKQTPERILPRFRAKIAPWPRDPQLALTIALLALELERDTAFRDLIARALRLRPNWESAALLKLNYLADKSPPQMPPYADGYLRKFPASQRFRIRYARLLLRANDTDKSLAQLESALRRDPKSSDALFTSALILFERDDLRGALKRMRRYLALNPNNAQARLYLADIHSARRDYAAAAQTLRAVASAEYRFDAQLALGAVIAHRDGIDAGIRHLRELAARSEGEAVRVILAQDSLYREFDLLERAKAALDAGLERIPGHPDLLYNRGLLAAQLNLLELHERDMRALLAQQPDNAHAYNALGYTLADQTERLDEALELITTALDMLPNDPFILDSMGWVHFRIGNLALAIDYLRRALAGRKEAEIAAHLGEALWVAGNKREAREIWEMGKQWAPDNATLLDTLERFTGDGDGGGGDDGGGVDSDKSSGVLNRAWLPLAARAL